MTVIIVVAMMLIAGLVYWSMTRDNDYDDIDWDN